MNGHAPSPTRAAGRRGQRFLAIALAASLSVIAGCTGQERLSGENFGDRLQRIYEKGSELWGRVAERAGDLQPDAPITGELEQAIGELLAFQRRAVDELGEVTAPEAAGEELEMLIEALQERTEAFEQALAARRFTGEQFERITEAGDSIALAFRRLGAKGFPPNAEDHDPH